MVPVVAPESVELEESLDPVELEESLDPVEPDEAPVSMVVEPSSWESKT